MGFKDFFSRKKKDQEQIRQEQETLDSGLTKTKESVWSKISHAIAGKSSVDDEVLDNLEEAFVTSDVGTDTTLEIIDRLQKRVAQDKYVGSEELRTLLADEITRMLEKPENAGLLEDFEIPDTKGEPYVIMVVGVNGVGKTTTIGKLAYQYKQAGYKVVLGAADTFPAAVAFDTVSSAKAQGAEVVIIDTAGRLHNKVGLMNELTKIKNVMKRVVPDAPQEILLVLDGSTGQNAFEQARQFVAATEVNNLAITKLDGTSKGGVVIGISHQFKIPVKYIGLGEKIQDLQIFHPDEFVRSLFGNAI